MSAKDAENWHREFVNEPLDDAAKFELMHHIVLEKFQENEQYRSLLLSTGDRVLHEAKGRGAPSVWEHQELNQEQRDRGMHSGGDWLGKIMTSVRSEVAVTTASLPDSSPSMAWRHYL